jgi:hypothetical protein
MELSAINTAAKVFTILAVDEVVPSCKAILIAEPRKRKKNGVEKDSE